MSLQQLVFGAGTITQIADLLDTAQAHSVLLVTGRDSYRDSGAQRAICAVLANRKVVRFEDLSPNPTLADVERGVPVCRELRPDIVVAVGGGSVLDTAKAVNLCAAQQAPPEAVLKQSSLILERPRPLIAVPTTAGSGSEATRFATIYVNGIKHSLAHDWLLPRAAIVDPCLTYSMPPRLTAITGLDALSQAIESYWAVGASADSQLLAEQAMGQMWPTLATAVRAPDPNIRLTMAHGAYLAGRAIDCTRTTAAHAISYVLTSRYGVPHGLAVALTMAALFEHYAGGSSFQVNDPRGAMYVERTISRLCTMLGCTSPLEAGEAWRSLLKTVGVETNLQDVGVQPNEVDRLVREVNAERLGNHPVRISPEDLREILSRAMCG